MKNKLLEIQNLRKNYHTQNGEIYAIDNISFNIENQEFVCIIGSSGCGKSTLLNILAELEEKSSGNIIKKENLKIGYMLQDDALFPWLTILDNALLGLVIENKKNKENIEYVISLLEKYGLKDFLNKYTSELSGGMRQRVG